MGPAIHMNIPDLHEQRNQLEQENRETKHAGSICLQVELQGKIDSGASSHKYQWCCHQNRVQG